MAGRLILLAAMLLSGCFAPKFAPAPVVPKPIIETRTKTVVRIERIATPLSAKELSCPPDPALPLLPDPKSLGQYIADITQVADECRAKLEVLKKAPN